MSVESWLLFVSIALVATLSPGPAILLVSTHAAVYGVTGSLAAIAGNITGLFMMSLLSILGLSTVILNSATVFTLVKLAGAMYLIYLGVRLWRNGIASIAVKDASVRKIHSQKNQLQRYRQGLLVALSNPKAIAFTTALFPQFIGTQQSAAPQFFILVSTFMTLSAVCLFGYACVTHYTRQRAAVVPVTKLPGRIFGGLFIGSGVILAFSNRQ